MTERMRAWVYWGQEVGEGGLPIRLEEVPIPAPAPGQLLLKVLKVSVCGTDEMLFAGKLRRVQEGVIPGHEFCGEIVETGSRESPYRAGQVVAGESHYSLPGSVEEGVIGLWPPKMADGSQPEPLNGAYAEYVCIPESCAHLLPDNLIHAEFWPSLFEPAGNDFLLARYVLRESPRGRVGVFGCGPHGLYAQIFLRHFGIDDLIAFETDPYRRAFASRLGCARLVLDPSQEAIEEQVQEATAGSGFDVSLDMVGKGGEAFDLCCRTTRNGGTVILFGLFSRDFQINGFLANDLIFARRQTFLQVAGKQLKVVGITGREGIWDELIQTVASEPRLQKLIMQPVQVVGPLNLLGQEIQKGQVQVLKRAFWAFE